MSPKSEVSDFDTELTKSSSPASKDASDLSDVYVPPKSILVDGKVYDTEKLAQFHPGGKFFLRAFSGRDASIAFVNYHRRPFPHQKVTPYLQEIRGDYNVKDNHDDFFELVQRVEKVIPRKESYAPWHYYIKLFFILGTAVSLEAYIHYTQTYVWYLSGIVGLFYALIGLNVLHDANHGAINRNGDVNRVIGLSSNWVGFSANTWIHQHVVQHHFHTNDQTRDPDITTVFDFRFLEPVMEMNVFQYIFWFCRICNSYVFSGFISTVQGKLFSPMSVLLVEKYRITEAFFSILYAIRWVIVPLYMSPNFTTLFSMFVKILVTGYYLTFFFIMSHNFEGVPMVEDTRPNGTSKKSFLYNQVVTSSNVGGSWLGTINGGLNYQIEHHLFPRMNHTHYPKIAPIVRDFCKERNIPYVHFPTVSSNFFSCMRYLLGIQKQHQH